VVYNDDELLGERELSKEVAMDAVNFVIRGKGFYLRYLRTTCGFSGWLVSPSGVFFTLGEGAERRKKSADGMISPTEGLFRITLEMDAAPPRATA
jgi:hypothetical protein